MKKLSVIISLLFFVSSFIGAHDHSKGNDLHAKGKSVVPIHGGKILEVGEHVAHLEFVHNLEKGLVKIYVLNKDGQALGIQNAPRVNLTYKNGNESKRKQLITKAIKSKDGKSIEFEAQDSILKTEGFEGQVSIKINDKVYKVSIVHSHKKSDSHGGHDHGDGHNHDHGHKH